MFSPRRVALREARIRDMLTVLEILKRTTEFLSGKGVDSPRLNAELLIGRALGLQRMQLYLEFERPLTEAELERIRPWVRRRGLHEPLQYILGDTEFCGIQLRVDRRALIPRPETEQLVELALAACPCPPARILDMGTGSGAIALALARAFSSAQVLAIDVSATALDLARENATAAGMAGRIEFLRSTWLHGLPATAQFELIVANPPYLSEEETAAAPVEVKGFEPAIALTSGAEGKADLVEIITGARRFLAPSGVLAVETGPSQHPTLVPLATGLGYVGVESKNDLAGRNRFIIARQPPS